MIRKTGVFMLLAVGSAAGVIAGVGTAYLVTLRIDAGIAKRRRNRRLVMQSAIK